jgi:hypothetical protein
VLTRNRRALNPYKTPIVKNPGVAPLLRTTQIPCHTQFGDFRRRGWRCCKLGQVAQPELIIDSGEVRDKCTLGDNAAAAVLLLHLLLAVPPVFVVAHLPTFF